MFATLRGVPGTPDRVSQLEAEVASLRDRVAVLESTTAVLQANAAAIEGVRDEVRSLVTDVAEELNRRAER